MELPVIIVYPDFKTYDEMLESGGKRFCDEVVELWRKLPILKSSMENVPT